MNEYAKKILPKVSCWKSLFKKELIKCINWAEPEEWFELRNWCYDKFYDMHPDILDEVYESRAVLRTNAATSRKIVTPSFIPDKYEYLTQRKMMS